MNHEVFISYQTESLDFVKKLCNLIESHDVKCWYGARDIRKNHANEIPKAIEQSKIFLLVVDDNVATHPREDILNEVYLACERFKKGNLDMITTANITPKEYENSELLYHIGRLQKKFLMENNLPDCAFNLLEEILLKLGRSENYINNKCLCETHYRNDYFDINDEHERNRLKIQEDLLRKFDADVYDSILEGKTGLNVLDIGCNEGVLAMDRFGNRSEVSTIVGVDLNEDVIKIANEKYGADNEGMEKTSFSAKAFFYALDCEDSEFEYDLQEKLEPLGIEKFDIIHISMLLLHVERPEKLLKHLRRLLKGGGKIFIRDIDDTLTFVSPDVNGYFKRMMKICEYEALSGFRYSGEGIYSMLINNGYVNVRLEKKGLDTSGMSPEEKNAMFETYFSFIYEDTKMLYRENPANNRVKADYEWLMENYEEIKRIYDEAATLFQLGFMTYTAERN